MRACYRRYSGFVVLLLFVTLASACGSQHDIQVNGYSEYFYSNAAQYSYIAENKEHIYYSNVYDQRRLYRWDKDNSVHELIAEYLLMSGDITAMDQTVYFSAWDVSKDKSDVRNIYRFNTNDSNIEMLIEKAISPLVIEDQIYYLSDDTPRDVYVYDMKSGTSQVLIEGLDCIGLVYTKDVLYTISDGKGAILRLDLKTNALQETIVQGGAASLSLYDNVLYFCTIYDKCYGYMIDLKTDKMQKVVDYNNGDFYFLGITPSKQYIYFSGSKLIDNRTTKGMLYRQDRVSCAVEEIAEFPADRFYIINEDMYIFRDNGTSRDGANIGMLALNKKNSDKANLFIDTMDDIPKSQSPIATEITVNSSTIH